MKISRSVRFSEELWTTICWLHQREGGDISEEIRRLLKKGVEREIAELYRQGKVSLREAADLLARPHRETLELFREMGVPGNVTMAQSLAALDAADALMGE